MDTNPFLMLRHIVPLVLLVVFGAGEPTALAAQSSLPPPTIPPATKQWVDRTSPSRCNSLTASTSDGRLREELQRLPLPDSATAVELAVRALGGRGQYPKAFVTLYVRAPNGILIAFQLLGHQTREDAVNTRDGTATVYVSAGRCVTLLGW